MRLSRVVPAIIVAALAAGAVKFAEVYAMFRAKAAAKPPKADKRVAKLAKQIHRLNIAVSQLQQLEAQRQAKADPA